MGETFSVGLFFFAIGASSAPMASQMLIADL